MMKRKKAKKRKRKKNMRKTSLLVLILILFILILITQPKQKEIVESMIVERSEDLFFVYQITRYPASVEIIQTRPEEQEILIGISVDPWDLNFGIVPAGSAGRRFVDLSNLQDSDVKVKFEVYGNISPMVSFSRNNFILKKGENSTVDIVVRTTRATLSGNYTGEIDTILKKPKYDFAYKFLEWF